jgi:proline racemase
MRLTSLDAHVAGAAVRLVTSGVPSLGGRTMAERQRSFERRADAIRRLICREPRGHPGVCGVVFTDAAAGDADAGLLFFNGHGYLPLCGHALVGATVLALDRGLLALPPGRRHLGYDTVAGRVAVTFGGPEGRQERVVRYVAPPAFVLRAGVSAEVGSRSVKVDVVWSGSEFLAIVDAESAGVPLVATRLLELRQAGIAITEALDQRLAIAHPADARRTGLAGTVLIGPAIGPTAELRSAVVYGTGAIDRSPSGSATVAVTTVLSAMGMVAPGQRVVHEGLLGSSFTAAVVGHGTLATFATCEVEIEAAAYATGEHIFTLSEDDPLPDGIDW